MVRPIDNKFFDTETKQASYILGVSFARYSTYGSKNTWRSSSPEILKIVKKNLNGGQVIRKLSNTFVYQARDQYLQDKLKEKGLDVSKPQRLFPEVKYLDHFVRGFLDANVTCPSFDYFSESGMTISYASEPFLQSLYSILQSNGVETEFSNPMKLVGTDVTAVHDLIYKDWKFIRRNQLYLPSKRDKFKAP